MAIRFCIIQRAHRRSSFFSRPTRWAIAVLSFLCLSAGCVQRVPLLFYVRLSANRPHTFPFISTHLPLCCVIQTAHRRSLLEVPQPTRWAIAVLSFLCLSASCVQRVLLLFYVRPSADRPHTIVAKGKLTMLYYTQRQPSGHNRICSEKKPHDQLHTAKQQAVHTS